RAAEYVHQDHAGAAPRRQPHEGAQRGRGDLATGHGVELVGHLVHLLHRLQRRLPVAPAQKIQRGVVRDPKQPALGIGDRPGCGGSMQRSRIPLWNALKAAMAGSALPESDSLSTKWMNVLSSSRSDI